MICDLMWYDMQPDVSLCDMTSGMTSYDMTNDIA